MSLTATCRCAPVALGLTALVVACGSNVVPEPAAADAGPSETVLQRYLHDPHFRRAELEASLVAPTNGYSSLRLGHYDTGVPGDWSRLAEWNPRATPLLVLGPSWNDPLGADAIPLTISAAASNGDEAALRALGEEAFFHYPVQELPYAPSYVLETDAGWKRVGFWRDDAHGMGGLVRAPLADGSTAVFLSCATCHAQLDDSGRLCAGRPNAHVDLNDGSPPGVVDVNTAGGAPEPERIADLRPVRFLSHLQADATVKQNDVIALAIRIETLLITGRRELLRPPREVALGLALYVWSLAEGAPLPTTLTAAEQRGQNTFNRECASCHVPPSFTGAPVPIDAIGPTWAPDPSAERSTGLDRVPSLHFVSTRGPLLRRGDAPSLDVLFDPARVTDGYTGGTSGLPVRGHVFGLDLDPDTRADLLAYLRTL